MKEFNFKLVIGENFAERIVLILIKIQKWMINYNSKHSWPKFGLSYKVTDLDEN